MEDPRAKLAEIEERLGRLSSPFRTADAYNFDEIIDPRDTRRLLCEYAALCAGTMGRRLRSVTGRRARL